jgi:ABC-type transport system involved in cytochrome bd biosynthesis fused ATPase/permease subunit
VTQRPLDIRFERLGLRVGDGGRRVLSGVSGHFKPSRMACIMGPSGCGKTTLLNALCGRAGYGAVQGQVRGVTTESSLGDTERWLGDAKNSLGDAKSSLSDAKSSQGDTIVSLSDAKSSLK